MPATLTIPTIFTAVDKLSSVVSRMGKNISNTFGGKMQAGISRFNDKFNGLIPGYNAVKNAVLGYVGAVALAGAVVAGVVFSSKALLNYEQNVAGLHAILNDLTDNGFKPFQAEIDKVAKTTRYSAVDVASSFAKIAQLNIGLAKTPESLGQVSAAAITLSRAAKIDLVPATESLVGIMAQFHLQGSDANRVINVLAAGMKYGSATIEEQAETYKGFGTIAKTANITLEQSAALTQVLAKYQLKGAEAGTALRGVIIRLQKAGAGYASGQFNINDALAQAQKKYDSLATARQKDAFLIKLFGIRAITAGRLLLQNADLTNRLTVAVTGTNQAQAQAARNMDTVLGTLTQLGAQFINYITSSDNAKNGMLRLKNAIKWVTDNLDTILDRTFTFVKWFLIVKGVLWAAETAFAAYNIVVAIGSTVMGLFAGTTATATAAISAETIVVTGFAGAMSAATTNIALADAATTALGASLAALAIPAGLIAAIAALASFGIYTAIKDSNAEAVYANSFEKNYVPISQDVINEFNKKPTMRVAPVARNPMLDSLLQTSTTNSVSVPVTDAVPALGRPPQVRGFNDGDKPLNIHLAIDVNDPGDHIKDVKHANPGAGSHIRITSTTGQK